MTMRQVSRYFDRVRVTDIETGADLFKAQFNNYDGSKRDAFAAYRRIMSVDPDIVVPATRCVSAMGKNWVIGDDQVDGWGELHRRKFVMHEAQGRVQTSSLADLIAGNAPAQTWGDLRWVGATAEEGESSDRPAAYTAVLPYGAQVRPYDILTIGDTSILVQTVALLSSGFLEARGLLQESSPICSTLCLVSRVFDPVAGGYREMWNSPQNAAHIRWQELFVYSDQMDQRFQEGDSVIAVAPGSFINSGDVVLLSDRRYVVKAVKEIAGIRALHARPAVA